VENRPGKRKSKLSVTVVVVAAAAAEEEEEEEEDAVAQWLRRRYGIVVWYSRV